MRRSTWKTLAWQGVGLLCYLVGMLLFLLVVVELFSRPPGESGVFSTGQVTSLAASLVLIVLGRWISWRFGGDGGLTGAIGQTDRDESPLEDLGYRVPRDSSDPPDSPYRYENGEMTVVCPQCGTENDPAFTYCRECSIELPE